MVNNSLFRISECFALKSIWFCPTFCCYKHHHIHTNINMKFRYHMFLQRIKTTKWWMFKLSLLLHVSMIFCSCNISNTYNIYFHSNFAFSVQKWTSVIIYIFLLLFIIHIDVKRILIWITCTLCIYVKLISSPENRGYY
jgi:hypothetical protein